MSLKINRRFERCFNVFVTLACLVLAFIALKLFVWENQYYASKSLSVRSASAVLVDRLAYPSNLKINPLSPQNFNSHQVAPEQPRFIDLPHLNLHARVQIAHPNERLLPLPQHVADFAWFSGSKLPEQKGSLILTAFSELASSPHPNTRVALSELTKLSVNDQITLTLGNAKKINYHIKEIKDLPLQDFSRTFALLQARQDKPYLLLLAVAFPAIQSQNIAFSPAPKPVKLTLIAAEP